MTTIGLMGGRAAAAAAAVGLIAGVLITAPDPGTAPAQAAEAPAAVRQAFADLQAAPATERSAAEGAAPDSEEAASDAGTAAPDADSDVPAIEGSADLEDALAVAEHWQRDALYVDPRIQNPYPASTYEALREKLALTKHPTYLAFLATDDYTEATDFATLLANAHGDHGVFLVASSDGLLVHSADLPEVRDENVVADQMHRWNIDPNERMSDLEWLNDVLDRLADPQEIEYRSSPWNRVAGSWYLHPVRNSVIVGVILLAVLAGVWLLASRRPVKKRKYRIPVDVMNAARSASRRSMRDGLGGDALRIAERLESLQTQGLSPEQSETVQQGLDAYGLARRIAEDESAREDDLVGALVLFDLAERSLESVERQRSSRLSRSFAPRGLCTVNPRHGEARKSITVDSGGAHESMPLPVCGKCAADQKSQNPLQWLRVDGKPYPERRTVWADTLYGATEADLVREVTRARATA